MTEKGHQLDGQALVTVAQRADEASAAVLVSILDESGIRAIATGGFTSGFRAEAPGMISIKTLESDAERAIAILSELKVQWPEELQD